MSEPDWDKIEEAGLAILFLARFNDGQGDRAWKGMDWGLLDRLFERGLISDPKGKAKSVRFTEEGLEHAEAAFGRMFCEEGGSEQREDGKSTE